VIFLFVWLTPWSIGFLEKPTVSHLVKKLSKFYGSRSFVTFSMCSIFRGLIRRMKMFKRPTVALGFKNVILSYSEYRHASVTDVAIFRMMFLALPLWGWPNQWPKHFDHVCVYGSVHRWSILTFWRLTTHIWVVPHR